MIICSLFSNVENYAYKIDGIHRKHILSFTLFDNDMAGLILHDFELPRDLEHRIVVEGHEKEVRSELRGDEGHQLRVGDPDPLFGLDVGGGDSFHDLECCWIIVAGVSYTWALLASWEFGEYGG